MDLLAQFEFIVNQPFEASSSSSSLFTNDNFTESRKLVSSILDNSDRNYRYSDALNIVDLHQ